MSDVGCDKCWSPDASVAWDAILNASIVHRLIDESHFIVSIRECSSCKQHYLQVMTETIDWEDGEDPVYRTVLPVSVGEKQKLINSSPVDKTVLESIGTDRRSLKYDWPKGKPQSLYWGVGISVGIHD